MEKIVDFHDISYRMKKINKIFPVNIFQDFFDSLIFDKKKINIFFLNN